MPYIRDRVIKGGTRNNVDIILEAHDSYRYYLNRWRFLADSYNGGYEYFMGKYLEPYYYESRDDYEKRLRQLGLDNHVSSVADIYNSFLFRKPIRRDFGSIETDPGLAPFLKDADLDGRSFEAVMRELSAYAMVYGNVWCVIDKPDSAVMTRADELAQGIRPYVSIFTPENVLDWHYERLSNGHYSLTHLKVLEEMVGGKQYVREYTPTEINVYEINADDKQGDYIATYPNQLGRIPAVCVYGKRSNQRGIGLSPLGDIADIQKEIYEFNSEIEQIIRLTNHPSLVKSADTEASAGAGAIIQMPQGMDPGLKPFLLQPDGTSIEAVIQAIRMKTESIDRAASLGGIRSIESRRLSGIGLQTEFQMLNARLADFAMNLEHAEEEIWRLWAMWQNNQWDGEVTYPRSFSIQDKVNDIQMYRMAKQSNITDSRINNIIDQKIFETIVEEDFETYMQQESKTIKTLIEHTAVTSETDLVSHLREMFEADYTDDEILSTHPELAQLFGVRNDQ